MRIGVMCSGNGTNFENIVKNCPDHEVVLMIHNKKDCGAKVRAQRLGICNCRLKSKQDDEMIKLFKAWRVDLIVLAGWMRIVSPKFIRAFPRQIINIHPSLLPKYKGLHAVEQAFQSNDRQTGCTVHYVTDELDSGEIIDQSIVPIFPNDTLDLLTYRIQQAEHRLLPLVINQLYETEESTERRIEATMALQ
tara:strand:- start:4044 stop:4619 length:576 start_codon:yes stop_codon:yes gene_type:complete